MVPPKQWAKVKGIVAEALERNAGERTSYLNEVCSGDPSLRAEIDSLLAAHGQAEGFSAQTWAMSLGDHVLPPKAVGPYRLERELGVGGMGQVWLAQQTEPVQRWIALKLIRAGFIDATVVQRFLLERQSLALMNHPAIAKVFDAGTTPAGQPYFAMEYVEGPPITDYCDSKKLGLPERLRLFQQVCEGVQHAHQKAIIHRDLKPSNILIVEIDGKPAPRIIDFGLAKSAMPTMENDALLTRMGSFLGTPGYMSPEQADPHIEDVDTRTDVYSLGVVLYELLTGSLPFDTQRWKKQRLDEVLKEISERDPPRPSTKVSHSKESAESRGMKAAHLASVLRGDLDWIALKALEKDRDRRYGTTSELSADINRYLGNRPVAARPASAAYRIKKYVRRNRLAVSAVAGTGLLLMAFVMAQMSQLQQIRRERDRADRITKFMTGMFKVSDPNQAKGNTITAREILDKSSKEIDTGLAKDPELQAALMEVIGRVYGDLGLFEQAKPLLEKSVQSRRRILGPDNPKTLQSMDDLAWILNEQGHPAEAEKLQRQSLDGHRRAQGPDHADVRKSVGNLAVFVAEQGRFAEAEKLDEETLAICERTLGPEDPDTLTSLSNLAGDYLREGRYQDGEPLLIRALETTRRVLGPNHPLTLAAMNNLAVTYIRAGEYDEADKLTEETRALQRRVLGPEHPDTVGSTYNLACSAALQGHTDKAIARLREALEHNLGPNLALGMADDEDLKSLRGDPRFQTLVSQARDIVAARRQNAKVTTK